LTSTFASFLSAGTVIGWLLLTTRLGIGSAYVTCSGALKSGQSRLNFKVNGTFSPCSATVLSSLLESWNGALSRTAITKLRSSRVTVGIPCCGGTGQVTLAGRASRTTVWPLMLAVPLILNSPAQAAAVGAASKVKMDCFKLGPTVWG